MTRELVSHVIYCDYSITHGRLFIKQSIGHGPIQK
jgi:hypothetical protein